MLPTIKNECSQFLKDSMGIPLIKSLPSNNDGFRKVKIRKKKNSELIVDVFNETFKDDHTQLLQRSMFAKSNIQEKIVPDDTTHDIFYVFPIDGYRYMYSENVKNTTQDYKKTLDLLIETLGDEGIDTFKEVLKYQYKNDKIYEALLAGSEIIIYGIPYYYAIRCSIYDSYSNFLIS